MEFCPKRNHPAKENAYHMVKKLTTRNQRIFNNLKREGIAEVNILTMLLKENNLKSKDIATQSGHTESFISMVFAGKRNSNKVHKIIIKALGFNPWA